jgi:putative endonuclease
MPSVPRLTEGSRQMKRGFTYILAGNSGVLYTGVTNRLDRRLYEHRLKSTAGFTRKYNLTRLVYFESFADIRDAIAREKQIKGWLRSRKIALINAMNPTWRDLSEDFLPKAPPSSVLSD